MSEDKSVNSAQTVPEIYKEEEFNLMQELIENGLWKTRNLSKALHIDEDTISKWKKHPLSQTTHRKAILKYIKRRTDADKILKELEMDIEPDTIQIQGEPLVVIKEFNGSQIK